MRPIQYKSVPLYCCAVMAKRITRKTTKLVEQKAQSDHEELPIEAERDLSEYTIAEAASVEQPSVAEPIQTPVDEKKEELIETEKKEEKPTRKKRHWVRWTIITIIVGLLAAGAVYGYSLYSIIKNSITDKSSQHSAIEQIARIIVPEIQKVNGEENDRINVLLLGEGGVDYPGGTLTDTIMIASIQPSTKKVTLISIPRDLVVPIPPENLKTANYLKINSVLVHGDMAMEDKIMKMLTGLDINYYVQVDFDGFKDVIDAVGGVDVNVERAFTGDYGVDQLEGSCPANKKHSLEDGLYCMESFSAGVQHMTGYTALMYSRIRKVPSGYDQTEGTDFARAARQQKVIAAFKEKVFNLGTLLNPTEVSNLLTAVGKHASTDMEVWEMLRIGELVKDVKQEDITNVVLDSKNPDSVLVDEHSNTTGAFYLEPKAGLTDYSEIQAVINAAINPPTTETNSNTNTSTDTNENTNSSSGVSLSSTHIVVENGAGITGLAGIAQTRLSALGMKDVTVGNAKDRTQTTTHIYDLSGGQASEAITALQTLFGVTATQASLPTSTTVRSSTDLNSNIVDLSLLDETTDIVVVLGKDQKNLAQ